MVAQLVLVLGAWGLPSLSNSVSSVISTISPSDHLSQVSGEIILDPQFGTDTNTLGLVTCNRGYHVGDTSSCGPCEFLATIQRVLNFAFVIAVIVATIMFAYAGMLYLTSSTNSGNISKAKGIFWNVLFGFIAVLGAWIVVNTVLNILYNRSLTDVSAIACQNDGRNSSLLPNPSAGTAVVDTAAVLRAQIANIDQSIAILRAEKLNCLAGGAGGADTGDIAPADQNLCSTVDRRITELEREKAALQAQLAGAPPTTTPPGGTIPGTAPISTNPNVFIPQANITPEGAALVANNTNSYAAIIEAELARQGVPISPELVRAIMSAESGGNPNAKSPAGAVGLMQVLPSTARQYFPGLTDAQIEQELRNPQTNIRVGVQVLNANLNNPNVRSGNTNDLIASYNSGAGNQLNDAGKKPALADSSDCPGARAYECSINPGGLEETRNYVARVNYYNQYYTNQKPANTTTSGTNIPNSVNPAELPDGNVDLNY